MPAKLDRCVEKLMAQGNDEDSAWAICRASVGETFEDAEYQGREVTLNQPFRTPDGPKKFSVYVKNDKGNVVKVNFGSEEMEIKRDDPEARKSFRARFNCEEKKDRTSAAYWSCKMWQSGKTVSQVLDGHFNDAMTFDADAKTAVSVRDGFLEYLGAEIGMEPADRTFKVYRSPATIANACAAMKGIPLTDEHVDPSQPAPADSPVGIVIDGTMIDMKAPETNTTLAISNKVKLGDAIIGAIKTGKRELSLGYQAELVPYEGEEGYDLEQRNVRPHHLAVVSAGRCGPSCSFIDRKTTEVQPMSKQAQKAGEATLHAAFQDAEGEMSLEKIIEIATSLPEALKKMPLPKIQELMPALQEAMTAAEEAGIEPSEQATETVEQAETVEDASDEMEDEKKEEVAVTDTAEFKDAVAGAIKGHMAIVEKARQFVDENYTFQGKSGAQIMRDALAKEGHDAKSFADAELSVAFKLLKPSQAANTLGDGAMTTHRFSDIADKDI